MNLELVRRLILYLVDQLNDLDGAISKIRIVKMLYIIDLEHFRSYGETLTKLDWIYYHYGPFAFDINTAIKRSDLDLGEESFETLEGYRGFTYRAKYPQEVDDLVATAVKFKINRIITHWALQDTRDLLDYVYNDTEPMRSAVFMHPLDFSTVRRGIRVSRQPTYLKLSEKKSSLIQKMLKQRIEKREVSEMTPPRYDNVFFESMAVLEEEDTVNLQTHKNVTISADAIEVLLERDE